uniref:Membrane protein, putative n=1 Tax=Babesia bovis TaxID=5865 RepID=A7ASB4_BABBO|eukprot:XP_001611001.1 hypothetical protein [Babesia bovis T2Bo]
MQSQYVYRLATVVISFLLLNAFCDELQFPLLSSRQPSPNLIVGKIRFPCGQSVTEISELDKAFAFRTNNVDLTLDPKSLKIFSKFKFDGNIAVKEVNSGDVKQWTLREIDLFGPRESNNWMPGNISTCGRSGDYFLGGPCQLSNGRVHRYYFNLPEHTEVRLTGRIHFFDQWEESHNWCPSLSNTECIKYGIDSCGQEYPDRLSPPKVHFDVFKHHTRESMALEINSNIEGNPCEASWGIDDIALYLR